MAESKKESLHANMERTIEGFDIDLTREKLERIDRLVESRILARQQMKKNLRKLVAENRL